MTSLAKPSNMQRVAADLAPQKALSEGAAVLSPRRTEGSGRTSFRLSELTPADIRCLRIEAQIEAIYPEKTAHLGPRSAASILARWKARNERPERIAP